MKPWQRAALELRGKKSQRQIAKEVLGSESKKSTIGDFFRRVDNPDPPKVISLDIETSPMQAFAWRRWKENISQVQVMKETQVLCWAAKDLGSEQIMFCGPEDPKRWEQEEESILREAHAALDSADIVIAHNGRSFDIPVLNTRMLLYGMKPPSPYKIVDTLKIARAIFRFPSNRLDDLAQYLGLGQKLPHTGFQLWKDCVAGDPGAWDTMMLYNQQDVLLLEEVYRQLMPWDRTHPNLGLYYGDSKTRCTGCGSENIEETDKYAFTNVSKFPVYQCNSCGKWSRARSTILSKEAREHVLANCR